MSLLVIKKVASKAGITHAPLDPEGIRPLLKQEWKKLTEYMEEAARRRDKSLEDFIKSGDKDTETKRLEALKQIKYREKSKRRYRRIRGVLQRLKKGGITHLDIPIYDRHHNIIGWDTISSKDEVHQALINRNHKHLNQASKTPFGHGEGYNLIHDEDKREASIQAILDGTFTWKHRYDMVKTWVENLKRAYDKRPAGGGVI